jgi:hypothetical protein
VGFPSWQREALKGATLVFGERSPSTRLGEFLYGESEALAAMLASRGA